MNCIFSVAILLPSCTLAGTSTDYRTDFETTGMSAGASASASYSQNAETGAESAAVSLSADNYYSARQGFAGQLYTVQSVELPEMDPLAVEGSTFTLHPRAFLDDLTIIDAPDRFTYADLTAFTSTSAAGLCTVPLVYDRTFADIYISFEDVDNNGVIGIEDTDIDNYPAFGGDGVADSWQVLHFGESGAALAAAGVDADGDGMDNRAEFQQGYNPRNAASAMQISLGLPPGQTQVTWGPLLRNYGIGVRLMQSGDLTNWTSFPPAVPRVNLPGGFLRDTDMSATTRRFYKIQWPVTSGGYNSFFQYGQNDSDQPSGRVRASLFWTGRSLLMWGGELSGISFTSTGAVYHPLTDTWTPMSNANAPLPRQQPAAVWTGSELIVYGGLRAGSLTVTDTGGRYDPVNHAWSPLPGHGLLNRRGLTGTWTGREAIFCGGDYPALHRLDIFNPVTGSWRTVDPPPASLTALHRTEHTAVWTGTELLVWGGIFPGGTYLNNGWRINPATGQWASMAASPLTARAGFASVWTGSELMIWGGFGGAAKGDGARYNPATDSWTLMPGSGAPAARFSMPGVWTGRTMAVWGGVLTDSSFSNTGAAFDPVANTWTPLPAGPPARMNHAASWTGDSMFCFGGATDGGYAGDLWAWVGAEALVP